MDTAIIISIFRQIITGGKFMVADQTANSTKIENNQKNMLTETQAIVKDALDRLGYPNEVYELLKDPIRVLTVRIPVKMDDGSTKVFTGYRAQHNDAVGPTKGGVRVDPLVTQTEVNALAIWMSLKAGMMNLRYRVGRGASVCVPRESSWRELEGLS